MNISPTLGDEAGRSSRRDDDERNSIQVSFDLNQANDVMMNF